jgi:hypothetical protein
MFRHSWEVCYYVIAAIRKGDHGWISLLEQLIVNAE